MPNSYEINQDPLRNNGEVLYREFLYVNDKTGKTLTCKSKGELYIPEMLYWINFCGEQNMLAPFILYVFLKDFNREIYERKLLPPDTYSLFREKAGTALIGRNYRLPGRNYIRTLPIYRTAGMKEYTKYIAEGKKFKSEETLAEAVAGIFTAALKDCRMEYWHFPAEAYRYANEQLAVRAGQKAVFPAKDAAAEKEQHVKKRKEKEEKTAKATPHPRHRLTAADRKAVELLNLLSGSRRND
jgi:hypothetical protein